MLKARHVPDRLSNPGASPARTPTLRPTRCALCATEGNATELYPARFAPQDLNPTVFSARRNPDRLHFRVVRCRACGLVRSDPVADRGALEALYVRSSFDYGAEVPCLRRTYARFLERARRHAAAAGRLLEIGCGNGFFLEEARRLGVAEVRGVEPSRVAVASAPAWLRARILRNTMRPGLFPPGSFDIICLFQVFDHMPDPGELTAECLRLLRPGGVVLALNHNVEALTSRLLGERSPIIDIEHTFLYGPATMRRVFERSGFEIVEMGTVWNTYSLGYLVRLLPLPGWLKRGALVLLRGTGVGRLPLTVPLGNLYQIARKSAGLPAGGSAPGEKVA